MSSKTVVKPRAKIIWFMIVPKIRGIKIFLRSNPMSPSGSMATSFGKGTKAE